MLSIFWNLIAFLVALGVLITVHELGHFWIAQRCGVRVERFSIGFGKSLLRGTNRNGTEFIIALIPCGGYVKMLDERVEAVAHEVRHYAFNNKTISQRAAIIAAGPVANFIFAIFAYWLVFINGVPGIRPIVGEIIANSVAEKAEIISGMELKAIDGVATPDWSTVRLQLASKIGNEQTTFTVSTLGSSQQQEKVLDLRRWSFDADKEDLVAALGIRPRDVQIEMVLAEVQDCSAARKAGLKVGDRIVKVDGQTLTDWMSFINLVRNNHGKPLPIEVERQGKMVSLMLTPRRDQGGGNGKRFAGVAPKVIPLPDEYKTIHQYGPCRALVEATRKTWQMMQLTVNMLRKLLVGNVKFNDFGGPIFIAKGAGISAKLGVVYYLMFLAFISVNLGIVNLFPLPVLDGGHLLFLVIEKLKGDSVSRQVQDVSDCIGSIVLMTLMGLALLNDFSRL